MIDQGFGLSVAWDIDLLSGYKHRFLTTVECPANCLQRANMLTRWLTVQDTVIFNGYINPWMLAGMMICRSRGIPYLLRVSSHSQGQSAGFRRHLRQLGTHIVVSGSAGGLSMGQLNEEFYRQHRVRRSIFAPNSVDDERFARPPQRCRSDLLAGWGLDDNRPVVMFSGKFVSRKRPLDLAAAVRLLPRPVTTLFVGDGPLAGPIRSSLDPHYGVVTGFVNQAELPSYYHAADILVLPSEVETWGLVVNEAMAAGTLPVVSDRVGAAPDLVRGMGEVFRCGDVPSLVAALSRALEQIERPGTRNRVREHAARYSLDRTVEGYEEAALAVSCERRPRRRS